MGFYYGSSEPPQEPGSSWREVLIIIFEVFRTLALPLGMIFGVMAGLVFIFYLFVAVHPLAGLAVILLIVAAIAGYGLWERYHPPSPEDIRLGR
jgi:hypothetical protein